MTVHKSAASAEDLLVIARLLQPLSIDLVFTGGVVVSLLVTDPVATPMRETYDVDVYLHDATRVRYQEVEATLRRQKFSQRSGDPVCRWTRGDLVVDLMADDESILGFTNRWYRQAAVHAQVVEIEGVQIRVITAPFFIATKLEAFADPSRENSGDLLASRDVEDIIAVIDGRPTIAEELRDAPGEVRVYLPYAIGRVDRRRAILRGADRASGRRHESCPYRA